MTAVTKINMGESVRARLNNIARAEGSDFAALLTRFVLERVLYRIGQSKYRKQFLLKGAMLFALWYDMPHRATRDIDLMAYADNDLTTMKKIFQEIINISCDDGVIFDTNKIAAKRILQKNTYVGVNVKIQSELAKARCQVNIDIGFGDAVTPLPVQSTYPVIIKDFPAPKLKTYPVYTVVAEKLHAIAMHGLENSRVKDYLDLLVILKRENLDQHSLQQAISATFSRRGSTITTIPLIGLSDDFANNPIKQIMWSAFLRKNQLPEQPFLEVVKTLREKLQPILDLIIGS